MQKSKAESKDIIREFFKKWPRFYLVIGYIFGPVLFLDFGPRTFLKKQFPSIGATKILNVGSGPTRLRSDITNIDITPYEEVDIVADITQLPFADSSIDGFVCDNVLEHVQNPVAAVAEIHRILKHGAVGYVSTPFLYPFHASPHDYQRWTAAGLENLLKDFSEVDVRVRSGLFSTLNVWLCYVLPSFCSFGSDRLYWLLVNVSLFIFFPVKLLDIVAIRLPFASHTAAVFYCVVKK